MHNTSGVEKTEGPHKQSVAPSQRHSKTGQKIAVAIAIIACLGVGGYFLVRQPDINLFLKSSIGTLDLKLWHVITTGAGLIVLFGGSIAVTNYRTRKKVEKENVRASSAKSVPPSSGKNVVPTSIPYTLQNMFGQLENFETTFNAAMTAYDTAMKAWQGKQKIVLRIEAIVTQMSLIHEHYHSVTPPPPGAHPFDLRESVHIIKSYIHQIDQGTSENAHALREAQDYQQLKTAISSCCPDTAHDQEQRVNADFTQNALDQAKSVAKRISDEIAPLASARDSAEVERGVISSQFLVLQLMSDRCGKRFADSEQVKQQNVELPPVPPLAKPNIMNRFASFLGPTGAATPQQNAATPQQNAARPSPPARTVQPTPDNNNPVPLPQPQADSVFNGIAKGVKGLWADLMGGQEPPPARQARKPQSERPPPAAPQSQPPLPEQPAANAREGQPGAPQLPQAGPPRPVAPQAPGQGANAVRAQPPRPEAGPPRPQTGAPQPITPATTPPGGRQPAPNAGQGQPNNPPR